MGPSGPSGFASRRSPSLTYPGQRLVTPGRCIRRLRIVHVLLHEVLQLALLGVHRVQELSRIIRGWWLFRRWRRAEHVDEGHQPRGLDVLQPGGGTPREE